MKIFTTHPTVPEIYTCEGESSFSLSSIINKILGENIDSIQILGDTIQIEIAKILYKDDTGPDVWFGRKDQYSFDVIKEIKVEKITGVSYKISLEIPKKENISFFEKDFKEIMKKTILLGLYYTCPVVLDEKSFSELASIISPPWKK